MAAAWTPCSHCAEYWCRIHRRHVFECACPPVEDWPTNPYDDQPVLPTLDVVREIEIATPAFDAPFSLTSEENDAPDSVQLALWK